MPEAIKPFKWAHSTNANIQEPLEALKEKGWQYADVPTASNFNWLFNDIQRQLESSLIQIKELTSRLEKFSAAFKHVEDIAHDARDDASAALDKCTSNLNKIEHNKNTFFQLCELLKVQETTIRAYHPNFPFHPWPQWSRG